MFSSVRKNVWRLRIVSLNSVAGVIDLLYAVEGSYFVPAIYNQGLSPVYGSILLCVSPILGVLFQSYLGSASDQCKCRWGKRRPFILALTITCMFGLVLFPFTENLAQSNVVALAVLVVLATTLMDFSVGALQAPSRAYLLDVLPAKHSKFGNIVCSTWISVGASVGFGLGAIKWSSDFSIQVKIVCGLSLVITVICIALTLFSVNEQNPQLAEEIGQVSTKDDHVRPPAVDPPNNITANGSIGNRDILLDKDVAETSVEEQRGCGYRCSNNGFISSILGNLQFIKYMSTSMIILYFAQFFGFLAVYSEAFFFTDYVAEFIYNGDVSAHENSTAYQDYTEGVRIGSLALGVSAFCSIAISLFLGPLMKILGMRFVFVSSYVFSMLQSGVMIFNRNPIVLFLLSPAVFYMIVILLTIPFILVSGYDSTSTLVRKSWSYTNENLIGRACSILVIALLSSQAIALMINGPLKNLYGGAEALMVVVCISSFIGAVIASFVTVPYKGKLKKQIIVNNESAAKCESLTIKSVYKETSV